MKPLSLCRLLPLLATFSILAPAQAENDRRALSDEEQEHLRQQVREAWKCDGKEQKEEHRKRMKALRQCNDSDAETSQDCSRQRDLREDLRRHTGSRKEKAH
ncbi:MAG: hypothetical protein LBC37_03180, partial [Zoogloeaceae bacterium]|nr:hypothetical protein [Zoogloeaceae bacterium]